MLEINPCPGMAAVSKQGRDNGKAYVIISVAGKDFIYAADGDTRPLSKQKKKRVKHIKLTGAVFEGIAAKLNGADKKKLYDTEIKRALKLYKESTGADEGNKATAAGKQ